MRLLAACRQRTAAIAQYETCRAILGASNSARGLGRLPTRCTAASMPMRRRRRPQPRSRRRAVTPAAFDAPVGDDAMAQRLDREKQAVRPADRPRGRPGASPNGCSTPRAGWLTLVGPGGVGKTRLAQAAAQHAARKLSGGIAFASGRDLGAGPWARERSPMRWPSGSAPNARAAARSDVRSRIGSPGAPALGVLDNVETVPRCACAGPRNSSRRRRACLSSDLALCGSASAREWLFEVREAWRSRGAGDDRPACRRVRRQHACSCAKPGGSMRPGSNAADASRDAIERICAHVAGLPLALELAARGALLSGLPRRSPRASRPAHRSRPDARLA